MRFPFIVALPRQVGFVTEAARKFAQEFAAGPIHLGPQRFVLSDRPLANEFRTWAHVPETVGSRMVLRPSRRVAGSISLRHKKVDVRGAATDDRLKYRLATW